MVKPVKKKGFDITGTNGLIGMGIVVLAIGLTYMFANSKESKDVRSDAAKPVYAEASISIVETAPKLGDYVHYNYVLPKGVKEETGNGTQARIQTMCYQDGNLVYGMAMNAVDAKVGAGGEQLGGGSSQWQIDGGPASCVTTLYQWTYQGSQKFVPFATTNFEAGDR